MNKTTILLFSMLFVLTFSLKAQKVSFSEFINQPFDEKVSVTYFDNNFWWRKSIIYEDVKNPHTTNTDQIVHVKLSKSRVTFFKTNDRELLFGIDIQNRRVKLRNGIKTGMTKSELEAILKGLDKLKITNNQITFQDKYKISTCTLTFKNNKLKRIEIEQYID